MKRTTTLRRRPVLWALVALVASLSWAVPGSALDPKAVLRNLYGAPFATFVIYQVKPGMETPFLDAMVASGPYNRLLSGVANERILQALPSSEGQSSLFYSIGRYYDTGTADFIEAQRKTAVRAFLLHDPIRQDATLIEHLLADWGWEKGAPHAVIPARAFQSEEIFQKNLSSLSFFKTGYVGQVGLLELFPKGTTAEQVRQEVGARQGLSGASIFALTGGETFAVYSEFFKAPANADRRTFLLQGTAGEVTGGQAGTVLQNYVPR